MLRLFVAVDLTDAVSNAIAKFCETLRKAFPAAQWVRLEGMHVTLKFIGEVGENKLAGIQSALAEIRSPSPVDITFHGVGFFPNDRRPRVFWAGIDASSNLSEIAAEIETRFEPLGIARESRAFRPHLTLARFDDSRGIEKLHTAITEAGAADFGSVHTADLHLYQSELGRGGARYTRLKTFRFAPEKTA